jgi:AcrR family transcriptional regulator
MFLKDHIASTAFQLFSRNGIKRVSMDEVTRKANVSKRTLYDFFGDKESLLVAVVEKLRDPFAGQLELIEANAETALDTILLFNEKLVDREMWLCQDFYEDIKLFPKALQLIIDGKRAFIGKLMELLKRGEKEAVFLSDVNYDIISLLAQQQFSKAEPSDLLTKYTHAEVHNTIFFIFLRGICTEKGREILDKYLVKMRFKQVFATEKYLV